MNNFLTVCRWVCSWIKDFVFPKCPECGGEFESTAFMDYACDRCGLSAFTGKRP